MALACGRPQSPGRRSTCQVCRAQVTFSSGVNGSPDRHRSEPPARPRFLIQAPSDQQTGGYACLTILSCYWVGMDRQGGLGPPGPEPVPPSLGRGPKRTSENRHSGRSQTGHLAKSLEGERLQKMGAGLPPLSSHRGKEAASKEEPPVFSLPSFPLGVQYTPSFRTCVTDSEISFSIPFFPFSRSPFSASFSGDLSSPSRHPSPLSLSHSRWLSPS